MPTTAPVRSKPWACSGPPLTPPSQLSSYVHSPVSVLFYFTQLVVRTALPGKGSAFTNEETE